MNPFKLLTTLVLFALLSLLSQTASAQFTPSGIDLYHTGGKVGIGTSTPAHLLEVQGGPVKFGSHVYTHGNHILGLFGPQQIQKYFGSMTLSVMNNNEMMFQTNALERMRILRTGEVGIGVKNPRESLHLSGAVLVGNTTNSNPGTIRFDGTDFEGYDGTNWMSLTSSATGTATCPDTCKDDDWSGAGTGIMYPTDIKDSVSVGDSSSHQDFNVYGKSYFSGYVGMGKTNPEAKLHVWSGAFGLMGSNPSMVSVQKQFMSMGTSPTLTTYDAFTVDGDGQVGVGTDDPDQDFQVTGISYFDGMVGVETKDPDALTHIVNRHGNNPLLENPFGVVTEKETSFLIQRSKMEFESSGQGGLGTFNEVLVVDMIVDSLGEVGIGENNPEAKLHVNDTDGEGYAFRVQVDGATKLLVYENGGVAVGANDTADVPDNGLSVKGDLLVGSISMPTGYKAAIDGKVICEELKVENSSSWPDYVFTPEYNLMSINELENAISTNGHLPGIPAASEIDGQGWEVGEMQRLQMEKIEELTLYIIQLKSEIDELKAAN